MTITLRFPEFQFRFALYLLKRPILPNIILKWVYARCKIMMKFNSVRRYREWERLQCNYFLLKVIPNFAFSCAIFISKQSYALCHIIKMSINQAIQTMYKHYHWMDEIIVTSNEWLFIESVTLIIQKYLKQKI